MARYVRYFFAYDLSKKYIVLADRGQGILATLKKVKSNLSNHQEALKTAFTEIISGRAPEYRGNGLKFVKEIVETNEIDLMFYTGDAQIEIQKKNFSSLHTCSKYQLPKAGSIKVFHHGDLINTWREWNDKDWIEL